MGRRAFMAERVREHAGACAEGRAAPCKQGWARRWRKRNGRWLSTAPIKPSSPPPQNTPRRAVCHRGGNHDPADRRLHPPRPRTRRGRRRIKPSWIEIPSVAGIPPGSPSPSFLGGTSPRLRHGAIQLMPARRVLNCAFVKRSAQHASGAEGFPPHLSWARAPLADDAATAAPARAAQSNRACRRRQALREPPSCSACKAELPGRQRATPAVPQQLLKQSGGERGGARHLPPFPQQITVNGPVRRPSPVRRCQPSPAAAPAWAAGARGL